MEIRTFFILSAVEGRTASIQAARRPQTAVDARVEPYGHRPGGNLTGYIFFQSPSFSNAAAARSAVRSS
jgi:hypothetical protein